MSIYSWTQEFYLSRDNYLVYAYPQTTSTNDLAKDPSHLQTPQTLLFIADQQTHGRGQQQRVWLNTQPGHSLMATWSLPYSFAPQPHYTLLIGMALLKSLTLFLKEQNIADSLKLKWPNDIYFNQKKIAGILTETIQQGAYWRLNIGIGLNVFSSPDLDTSGSLMNPETNHQLTQTDWNQILKHFEYYRNLELKNNAQALSPESEKNLETYLIK